MKITKLIRFLKNYFPYPEFTGEGIFSMWRNRFLFFLIVLMVVLGLFALIPSLVISISEQLWGVALIDSTVYAIVLILAFCKRVSGKIKINAIISIFYLLGIFLLAFLGPQGAGFNWLMVPPILFGFYYGFRGAITAMLISLSSLILLTIPIYLELKSFQNLSDYGLGGWIVNSINYLVITTFLSLTLAFIIARLDRVLTRQKRVADLLKTKQQELVNEIVHSKESDRLKEAFLMNMSHEIRTPLNGIMGFSAILENTNLDAAQRDYVKYIQDGGNRLLRTLTDLLEASQLQEGQYKLTLAECNIQALLNQVYIRSKEGHKHQINDVEFIFNCNVSNETIVFTDSEKLKSILIRIIDNAFKFTKKGSVTVDCNEGDSRVEISIKDTGYGIDPEKLNLIFDFFRQGEESLTRGYEGTGLGLPIAKGILKLMNGTIDVISKPGLGTKISITLPVN